MTREEELIPPQTHKCVHMFTHTLTHTLILTLMHGPASNLTDYRLTSDLIPTVKTFKLTFNLNCFPQITKTCMKSFLKKTVLTSISTPGHTNTGTFGVDGDERLTNVVVSFHGVGALSETEDRVVCSRGRVMVS